VEAADFGQAMEYPDMTTARRITRVLIRTGSITATETNRAAEARRMQEF
jgi:hypothetical protein